MSDNDLVDNVFRNLERDSREGREFDNAIANVDIREILNAMNRFPEFYSTNVTSDLTTKMEQLPSRKFFVSELVDSSVVIWQSPIDTSLLKFISSELSTTVRWMAVYEPMRFWAYLEYRIGKLATCIIDPAKAWKTNRLDGDLLMGRGERNYPTMSDFLKAVADRVGVDRVDPVDDYWSFGTWDNSESRKSGLTSTETSIHWAIELRAVNRELHTQLHGKVPTRIGALLQKDR